MKSVNATFRLSILSSALLLAFGSACADDEIAELTKPESSISIGGGVWTNDRHQQGIYDGMRDKGLHGQLDLDISRRNDDSGTWYLINGRNLGLENREFRADILRQGDIGGFLEYGKTIRDNPYTFNTGLQGIGSTELTVGTNLGSFANQEIELGTKREMFRLGGFKTLVPGLEFKLDFKNERKTGTRQWGWGSAALFSVEPIDATTRQLEAVLRYSGTKLQLSGGYSGSWYDNDNQQVFERLYGATGGTSAGFSAMTPMSLPLSNQAHQVFMDGGYNFTPTTRGTFQVAYTKATQDESLPSYDLAAPNNRFVNAPSSLNGRIDTTLLQLGLSSRPLPKLSITANLRYYDVEDKTPLAGYVGNNTTGVATVYNTPHSYRTTSGKLEATYRLPANFKITGGVDLSDQERSYPSVGSVYVPFRSNITEVTYRVQLRRSLAENLNGAVSYLHSERDGSGYQAANGTAPYSNQINPIHVADRSRDKVRLSMDWEPVDKLSLQFRADHSRDEYSENGRPYGVKDGTAQLYAVDASYTFSEDWRLSAWYAYDLTKAREVGFRQGNASNGSADAIKDAQLKDVGNSFGVNLLGKLTGKLEIGAGFDWFRSTSSYPQDLTLTGTGAAYPAGAVGPLADVKNDLSRFKLNGKYALDKSSDLRLDFIHERWHTDDWSWSFANGSPFSYYSGAVTCTGCGGGVTSVVDGTTVTAKQTQSANFLGLRYIYKFQ